MTHKPHHRNNRPEDASDRLADEYLARNGLSFDFDAGREKYDYQVAIGDEGRDAFVGGKDRDYFWGLFGDDKLSGGVEDDVLYGDRGRDVLVGGSGGDRLDGGRDGDRLFGGGEADNLLGRDGDDYLDEGVGHGNLEGGRGDDILVGGQGPDAFVVDRESGDDVIRDFTAGPGMFDHLALRDLRWEDLRFEDTRAGVKISWDGGSVLLEGVQKSQLAQDDFMFADQPDLPPGPRDVSGPTSERPSPMSSEGPEFGGEKLPGREFDRAVDRELKDDDAPFSFDFQGDNAYRVVVGTDGNDDQRGTVAWDHFFGRGGNDRFEGRGGDDILNGDAGNDELYGSAGMDKLVGGMGRDRLFGGDQADELMGDEGDDYLDAGAAHDMVEGGMGNDTLRGGTGADAFIVDPDSGFDFVLDFEARGDAQGAFDHLALDGIRPDQVSVTDIAGVGAFVSWNTDGDADPEGGVTLQGVFKADLRQSDFMFVEEPGFVAGISDVGSHYIFA